MLQEPYQTQTCDNYGILIRDVELIGDKLRINNDVTSHETVIKSAEKKLKLHA